MKASDPAGPPLGTGELECATASRVPRVVPSYWVIAIASTVLGTVGSDVFAVQGGLGYGANLLVFLALFLIVLRLKLSARRHGPLAYWVLFTASAMVGTTGFGFIDRVFSLGYASGSGLLALFLVVILALWYENQEPSRSVERVQTASDEAIYWVAFLVANTLGTSASHFLSRELGIGVMQRAILIGGLLLLAALAHRLTKLSSAFWFWTAVVLTRPLGAAFAAMLVESPVKGGLSLGA